MGSSRTTVSDHWLDRYTACVTVLRPSDTTSRAAQCREIITSKCLVWGKAGPSLKGPWNGIYLLL
jgi:hypothetical protein